MVRNIKINGYIQIGKASEISEGMMKEYKIGDREILIARVKGNFYAANNICPHLGGKLGHGKLEGTTVTCPKHTSKFDLTDGSVMHWTNWTGVKAFAIKLLRSPRPIITYKVKIEGEDILVEL